MTRILLTIWLFCCSGLSGAAEELRPLVIYVNDQKPWGYYDSKGQLRGASVDFVRELARELDYPVELDIAPYHRLVKDFEAGRVDYTFFLESQRPSYGEAVVKLMEIDAIAVAPTEKIRLRSFQDLNGLRVGKIRGADFADKLRQATSFHCVEVHSYAQALELLDKGRLDAIIGTPAALHYALQDLKLPANYLGQPLTISYQSAWVYASANSPLSSMAPDIRAAVLALKEQQVLSKIVAQYMTHTMD